jgi:Mn-dependent DtxR family transcriptional regulator
MVRGRDKKAGDERYLIELLIHPNRGVFTSELAESLNVSDQTVRNRMRELAEKDYVKVEDLDAGNLYQLDDDGLEYLRDLLRDHFHT